MIAKKFQIKGVPFLRVIFNNDNNTNINGRIFKMVSEVSECKDQCLQINQISYIKRLNNETSMCIVSGIQHVTLNLKFINEEEALKFMSFLDDGGPVVLQG